MTEILSSAKPLLLFSQSGMLRLMVRFLLTVSAWSGQPGEAWASQERSRLLPWAVAGADKRPTMGGGPEILGESPALPRGGSGLPHAGKERRRLSLAGWPRDSGSGLSGPRRMVRPCLCWSSGSTARANPPRTWALRTWNCSAPDRACRRPDTSSPPWTETVTTGITFGGSYPGSLSSWMRLRFPHLVTGSVSSSGRCLPSWTSPSISRWWPRLWTPPGHHQGGDFTGTYIRAFWTFS